MTLLPNGGLNLVVENLENIRKKVGSRVLEEKETTVVHFLTIAQLRIAIEQHEEQRISIKSTIPDDIVALLNSLGVPVPLSTPGTIDVNNGLALLNRLGITSDGVLTIDGVRQGMNIENYYQNTQPDAYSLSNTFFNMDRASKRKKGK